MSRNSLCRARGSVVAMAAVLSMGLSVQAQAQTAESQGSDESEVEEDNGQLQAIVVTARRRSEDLQSTPVSVSAVTGDTLADLNLTGVSKVEQLVPNLTMKEQSGDIAGNYTFIRGIGTGEPLLTVDSPVGVYVDGVYLGRQSANNFDLVTPDRIEVLRGPQGTLFGRNTTGGAVNVISHTPARDFRAAVEAGYGSFDSVKLLASVDTGEWGDSGVTAYLAGSYRDRDGYVDNPNTPDDRDPGTRNSVAAFGKLHGNFGDFVVDITGDWNRVKGRRSAFQIVRAYEPNATYFRRSSTLYGGDPFVSLASGRLETAPFEPMADQVSETFGTAITLEYDGTEMFNVKTITAWRGWDSDSPTNYAGVLRGQVLDFTSPTLWSVQRVTPFVAYDQVRHQRQFSQEFQIFGSSDKIDYIAGVYYFNERASEFNTNAFTLALSPFALPFLGFPTSVRDGLLAQNIDLIGFNLGQTLQYDTQNESLAGFAQVSWRPMGEDGGLELTGGLRYTHDKRKLDQQSVTQAQPFSGQLPNPGPTPGSPRSGSLSDNDWSYLVSVSYQFTPDFMAYARHATGYKAGGFDARTGFDITGQSFDFTFEPEKAKSYEIGFKSELFDRHLRLNGAIFQVDYDSLQLAQYSGGNGFIPAADARYRGFELEALAVLSSSFTIDGSIGYLDRKYKKLLLVDPTTNVVGDYSSSAVFTYAPDFNLHVGAQYEFDVGFANAVLRADFSHSSRRYFTTTTLVNPATFDIADPGQDLLSARFTLADIMLGGNANLTLSVYGENLLDKALYEAGIDFGPSLGIAGVNVGMPRNWGVSARVEF